MNRPMTAWPVLPTSNLLAPQLPRLRLGQRRAVFIDLWSLMVESGLRVGQKGSCSLQPKAVAGLKLLQEAGFQLVVLSQQPGIAFGLISEIELGTIAQALRLALRQVSLRLAGFYYCPHHPDGTIDAYRRSCACRHQEPGLLLQAANELGLSLPDSWRISCDSAATNAAALLGCETVWLQSPLADKSAPTPPSWAYAASDMLQAVHLMLHLEPTPCSYRPLHGTAAKRAFAS